MKHSVTVAAAATEIVVAGLSGCSSTPGQKISTSGHAKVVVDGKDQNAQGQVTCQKTSGALQIAIGQPGSAGAVAVQATDANPPVVHQIALGTVDGVTLTYQQGSPGANVQATQGWQQLQVHRHSDRYEHVNPMAGMVNKPFEVDASCP